MEQFESFIKVEQEHFEDLIICALRYCQGRQTYMPSRIVGVALGHIKDLSNRAIAVMYQDCKDQERYNCYGDERIDKPLWLEFKAKLEQQISQRKMANVN